MNSPFDCTLDGVRLSGIDESICILDIRQDAPKLRETTFPLAGGGQRLIRRERESLSVQVDFSIQEPDVRRREEVFRRALAWADKGGALVISTRPDQQLHADCTAHAALHADDWMETLHITFTTTFLPYWEDIESTTVSLPESATLTAPGNVSAAPVTVFLVNQGDAPITSLTLRCGDTQMVFDGITIPSRAAFTLTQSEGIVAAHIAGTNALKYRTADSDDFLLAPCGEACPVSVTADQPFNAAFSVRGRYL